MKQNNRLYFDCNDW